MDVEVACWKPIISFHILLYLGLLAPPIFQPALRKLEGMGVEREIEKDVLAF